jgi:uncharacterized protein YaaN involved in tellurite resistance
MVAMQFIPLIKTMKVSNMNLVRKINSAFILTLPVFKQAIAQAVTLKRQRIQAETLSALDKKTNELLLKNAENASKQLKGISQLATGSSIKVDTLENSWKTIMKGIEETRQIEQEARKRRLEDQQRLEAIKQDFYEKYHMPDQ